MKAIDFDPDMPYDTNLYLTGKSWSYPYDLFPELEPVSFPSDHINPHLPKCALSTDGKWAYCRKLVKAQKELTTFLGSRTGSARFDSDVVLPQIWEKYSREGWQLWMSFTPSEHFSLRAGERKARGHTVIAGLGMGYQLLRVAHKPSVKRITVVELSQSLVDFVWPKIKNFLPENKPVDLVIGSAYEVMPELHADVALVDIYETYGNNRSALEALQWRCPNIDKWWGWGTAPINPPESYGGFGWALIFGNVK